MGRDNLNNNRVFSSGKMILVTGGAGFIGSHVCDRLLKLGHEIICLDNFNDYYNPEIKRKNIFHNLRNNKYFLEEIDIIDYEALKKIFSKYKIEKIIHLAARAGVRPSINKPMLYFDVNVKGTQNLLELARLYDIKTFIFGSSSSVYGNNTKIPFNEEDITENQISPYASTKKIGETLCKAYSEIYGINITCLRFFTVYGPRGRPDMAPYKFTDLIYRAEPIEMFGDGSSKRDYTYVGDIVEGIINALEKNYKFEIFNLGNSDPIELKKFISIIEIALNKKAKIIKKPIPLGDVKITYADITKSKKLLNYNPKTKLTEGIGNLVKWYHLSKT
jgi:UDP-glucuronate 4-epimerase